MLQRSTPCVQKMTAYHEGGHALVAMMTEGANRIHQATIMPRGSALGFVSQVPRRVAAALRMPIPHGMVPCKTWFVCRHYLGRIQSCSFDAARFRRLQRLNIAPMLCAAA